MKNERRQICTVEGENGPRFTKDQKYIVFTRQNNLPDGARRRRYDATHGHPHRGRACRNPPPNAGSEAEAVTVAGRRRRSDAAAARQQSQEYVKKEERELMRPSASAQNRDEQEAKRKQREKRKPFTPPAACLSPDCSYRPTENTSSLRSSGRRPGEELRRAELRH